MHQVLHQSHCEEDLKKHNKYNGDDDKSTSSRDNHNDNYNNDHYENNINIIVVVVVNNNNNNNNIPAAVTYMLCHGVQIMAVLFSATQAWYWTN